MTGRYTSSTTSTATTPKCKRSSPRVRRIPSSPSLLCPKPSQGKLFSGTVHCCSQKKQELNVMATSTLNPKVDLYLAKGKPFAQPIMWHLRALVHKGCPEVEETIKWSRLFFEYRGAILCNMSAFKEHCSFGFWGEEIGAVLREAKVLDGDGMGSLGRIASLKDLPSDKRMLGWIREAAAFVDNGQHTSPIAARRKVVKPQKQSGETP